MRRQTTRRFPAGNRGFTLTEILIAVTLIGVLVAIALPAFAKARKSSRIKQAESELEMISTALLKLAWDTGKWPRGLERNVFQGLETWDLSTEDAGLLDADLSDFPDWNGPYLDSLPVDPWGNNYFFDPDYRHEWQWRVAVGSFGPNGQGRNVYDSDNIYVFLDE